MKFTFKICEKIKEAWPIYKSQFSMFLLLILVTLVVKLIGAMDSWILYVVSTLLGLVLSFVWLRYSLALADKKEFKPFTKEALPTFKQFWNFLKLIILLSIIYLFSFILLIVPFFYVSGRLMFTVYLVIEKNLGARASIKESWKMTEGYGWVVFGKSFLVGLFMFVGFIAFFIGALITYPVGAIVLAMMYREFQKMKSLTPIEMAKSEEVKESPKEEAKEEIKEEAHEVVKEENTEATI